MEKVHFNKRTNGQKTVGQKDKVERMTDSRTKEIWTIRQNEKWKKIIKRGQKADGIKNEVQKDEGYKYNGKSSKEKKWRWSNGQKDNWIKGQLDKRTIRQLVKVKKDEVKRMKD